LQPHYPKITRIPHGLASSHYAAVEAADYAPHTPGATRGTSASNPDSSHATSVARTPGSLYTPYPYEAFLSAKGLSAASGILDVNNAIAL